MHISYLWVHHQIPSSFCSSMWTMAPHLQLCHGHAAQFHLLRPTLAAGGARTHCSSKGQGALAAERWKHPPLPLKNNIIYRIPGTLRPTNRFFFNGWMEVWWFPPIGSIHVMIGRMTPNWNTQLKCGCFRFQVHSIIPISIPLNVKSNESKPCKPWIGCHFSQVGGDVWGHIILFPWWKGNCKIISTDSKSQCCQLTLPGEVPPNRTTLTITMGPLTTYPSRWFHPLTNLEEFQINLRLTWRTWRHPNNNRENLTLSMENHHRAVWSRRFHVPNLHDVGLEGT